MLYAWNLLIKMQHIYANMVVCLARGDESAKRAYDRQKEWVAVFVAGQRVFMKTRLHGIFESKL